MTPRSTPKPTPSAAPDASAAIATRPWSPPSRPAGIAPASSASSAAPDASGIKTLIVGESRTFSGGLDWLREHGVTVVDLDSEICAALMKTYIAIHPDVWNEDIGLD